MANKNISKIQNKCQVLSYIFFQHFNKPNGFPIISRGIENLHFIVQRVFFIGGYAFHSLSQTIHKQGHNNHKTEAFPPHPELCLIKQRISSITLWNKELLKMGLIIVLLMCPEMLHVICLSSITGSI